MAQNIIPDSHANRLDFLKNLRAEINTNAPTAGIPAGTVTGYNAILDPLIDVYQTLVDSETATESAGANATQLFGTSHEALLGLINELKGNTKVTAGMRSDMRIVGGSPAHDPNTIKPRLKVRAQTGSVVITGSKDYAELVNLYSRVVGTSAWTLIGARRKKFPFEDQTPLKVAGTPEQREYMARGVIDDNEVGQPSDIVTVLYGG